MAAAAPAALYWWPTDAATVASDRDSDRRTVRVDRGTLHQSVIATGVVRPMVGAEIRVGSRISGTVRRLPVGVGDRVEAGRLLAELDPTAPSAALAEAHADLELARAQEVLASSVLERRRRLVADGLTSEEQLESAERDLAVATATVAARAARVRSAEILLGYTRITAPIAGVIAEVDTREGETVAADFSSPTFVTIVDLDRLEVAAYVDETDIGRVFVGQTATFTVDTYVDAQFSAVVTAVEPRAELQGNVVNYVVRLEYEPQAGRTLRPEMTAHVQLVVERKDDALTVPRDTLRRRDGRSYVVVERDGVWVEQEVEVGWRSAAEVEVVGGLEEGEHLEVNPT